MRDSCRGFLKRFGVVPETVYVATGRATALRRISARAAHGGGGFSLAPELAAPCFGHFEPPTPAEGC